MDTINIIITKKRFSEKDIKIIKELKNQLHLKIIQINEDAFDLKKYNRHFSKNMFITIMWNRKEVKNKNAEQYR